MTFALALLELSMKANGWEKRSLNVTKWQPDVFYCVGISVLFL